ncbi:MAG: hypothetical protein QW356_07160, partial [Candidatus Hadarchaeales archaeon]
MERIVLAREPLPLRFVGRNPRLKRLAEGMVEWVGEYVPQSGEAISVFQLVSVCIFFFLVSIPFSLLLAVSLSLLIHPLFALLLSVPVILLFSPLLVLKSKIGDRR